MDSASVAHPYALSDNMAPLPYKGNCFVYLFSVDSAITTKTSGLKERDYVYERVICL